MGLPDQFVELGLKGQCVVDLFVLLRLSVPDILTAYPPLFLLI